MRRVLLTVHKFFPEHRAGTEVLTLKVAQELQLRGYEVLVLTANPPDLDARHAGVESFREYEVEGVKVHSLEEKVRLEGYTFEHEYFHPVMKDHARKLISEFRPDLLHIFHAQNLSASIIEAAKEAGLPVICSTTDFWFVCPIVQLKRPDGSVCRGPGPGGRKCLDCYTPNLFPPQAEFNQALKEKYPALDGGLSLMPLPLRSVLSSALYKTYIAGKRESAELATVRRPGRLADLANKTDAIMVPTRLMRDIFVENNIREELIHHVPFGIDTAPLLPYTSKTDSPFLRFGFIGTLFEHKGPDLLIRAFQELVKEWQSSSIGGLAPQLKIYGDLNQFPDYSEGLTRMVDQDLPSRERIEFLGTFPNSELGPILQSIDMLVVPSRWYENTPLVIQSALATKTPLIVTNLGGMAEIVIHGRNGLVFELNSVVSLKEQLLTVLREPQLLKEFAANIPPERTMADMVDDIEKVYEGSAGLSLPVGTHDRISDRG